MSHKNGCDLQRRCSIELADVCGITEDGVYWNIKKLKEQGLIRRIGPDKGGYWEVVNKK